MESETVKKLKSQWFYFAMNKQFMQISHVRKGGKVKK